MQQFQSMTTQQKKQLLDAVMGKICPSGVVWMETASKETVEVPGEVQCNTQ